jgi:hypothetical protein
MDLNNLNNLPHNILPPLINHSDNQNHPRVILRLLLQVAVV